MTDLENFLKLYKTFGIELNTVQEEEWDGYRVYLGDVWDRSKMTYENKKFKGYSGFVSIVEFDKDGNFISQGFWE